MKFNFLKRNLFLLLSAFFLYNIALAQEFNSTPEAGKYYVIKNKQENGVLSNLNNGSNNVPISLNDYIQNAKDQIWELRAVHSNDNKTAYVLINPYFNSAIDMVLQSRDMPLVQWTPTMNKNQQVEIIPVENQPHTYQIKSRYQDLYFISYYGAIRKSSNENDPNTYFAFKEVEKPNLPTYDWQNQHIFRINNEPAHATLLPYANIQEWEKDKERNWFSPWEDPKSSTWLSLNGKWKVQWQTGTDVPLAKRFWNNDFNTEHWKDIDIPSCFEMKGYGDPLYINVEYPFNDAPPRISMKPGLVNSTGLLRRTFSIPESWNGKRIILHFDGIYGAAHIWVNGQFTGYTQEANNVSEFDVTPYVHAGENNISIQIIRWSDSSYLEGQDMWHMSGIHRDVYLYATPQTYIQDYFITDNISGLTNQATAKIQITIANRQKLENNVRLEVEWFDPNHQKIGEKIEKLHFSAGDSIMQLQQSFDINRIQRWSPETPNLYTVRFRIIDNHNKQEEVFSTKYGFRNIQVIDGVLWINGKRAFLFGVNTQDTHPLYGRAIDKETMLKDIIMMKRANMNILRTSHYPRQPKMMDMLDAYGLFVVDEADLECHKNWQDFGENNISSDPSWLPQMKDRVLQLVMRDRNHPSVLFWSMGNESAGGQNFAIISKAIKTLDPSRLVHYEGCTRSRTEGSDIWSVMYPYLQTLKQEANNNRFTQPYFMCEYGHAMGNAVGNLKEYVDAIKASKYGMGGCIWDWVDQSIYDARDIQAGTLSVNGFNKYISGWDKPGPHQGNFVNNGLTTGDRQWTAKLEAVKKVYQHIDFTMNNPHSIKITNNYDQWKLNHFNFVYALLENGDTIQTGMIDITQPVRSRGSIDMIIPEFKKPFNPNKEYFLNVSVQLKKDEKWAPKGFNVATEQFVLQNRPQQLPAITNLTEPLIVEKQNNILVVKTSKMELKFTKDEGLIHWSAKGNPIIVDQQGPKFSHFRFVENDGVNDNYNNNNGMTNHTWNIEISHDHKKAIVTFNNDGYKASTQYIYTIYSNGVVDFDASFTPKVKGLRRIGVEMQFNPTLQNVDYYARGPMTNYNDRHDGSFLGHYQTTVQNMLDSYMRPQSTGNRLDLRYVKLSDHKGNGILVETQGQVEFSALPYSDKELRDVRHMWNLYPSQRIFTHFDYVQQGLGNATCGPNTLDKYMCPSSGTYHYKLRFTPLQLLSDGIKNPLQNEINVTDSIYNLHGQKLTQPTKGLNIINGKKVLIQ